MAKNLIMVVLAACAAFGAHGRVFSLDLRNPKQGRARLAASASSQDDGVLRSFDLDAGVADVGEVRVGDELSFALFDDVAITLTLKEKMQSPLGGDVFIAEVAGYEGIKTAVVIRTSDGLTIDVQDFRNKRYYKVLSTPRGVKVREMEAKGFSCGCDALEQRTSGAQSSTFAVQSTRTPTDAVQSTPRRRLSSPSGQDETYVDILVAYDGNAALWADENGGGITNFAEAAVQKMNTAIANTGLDQSFHFRLLGVMKITATCADCVYALEAATDGYSGWEAIRANRERIGADIVTVLIDTGDAGSTINTTGYSWCLRNDELYSNFSAYAYNVCAIRAVDQAHTMTHEVGHNMGCGHSENQSSDPGPQLHDYSAGYYFSVDVGNEKENYHTIMAYGTDEPGGEEVPYFSSPDNKYLGVAVGDDTHDNSQTIYTTYAMVANWRDATGKEIEADGGNWPIEWVTSREKARALAIQNEKNIFLVSGRASDKNTMAARAACESPDVQRHLKANYICWYNDRDTQSGESSRDFNGYAVGNTLPFIAIIHAENGKNKDKTLAAEGGPQSVESLTRMLARASKEAVFSPESGTVFRNSLLVSITSKFGGAIYYTLDGTMPDRDTKQYNGPITIFSPTTIRARVLLPDGELSLPAEAEYNSYAMVTVSVAEDCKMMGTVSGGNKEFTAGEKVSLKATANKGAAFAGWFINGILASDAPNYSYVATGKENVELVARFVAVADDYLEVDAFDKEFGKAESVSSLALNDCFEVRSASVLTSLSISGLPTGVKYDAKTQTFSGKTPAKAGLFYVTCTAKNGNGYQYAATAVWNVGEATSDDCDDGQVGGNALTQLNGLMTGQTCSFGGFTAATAVSGLPSGLKFDTATGVISGVPTKPGKATISFTGKNKKKSQRTVIVADGGMHVLSLATVAYSSGNATGTATGGGVYAGGKSVTLKATPAKGCVFAGWFDADGNELSGSADFRSASFPYVMGVENVAFTAKFATEGEDGRIEIDVEDSYTTEKNGAFSLTIPVASISAPTVKVSNLPTGLKFDAKALVLSGVATKPGVYAVKVSATNASKKGAERTFELNVPNLLPKTFEEAGLADSYDCVAGAAPDLSSVLSAFARDQWTLALSGLPTGLKYDAKGNVITGIASKEGTNTVYFTATKGTGKDQRKEVATATFVVRFPTLSLVMEPFSKADATGNATVTGGGRYPVGKKVTLKATPGKGNVFLGWRRVGDVVGSAGDVQPPTAEPYLSQSASFNYVTTDGDVTFAAVFATATEDKDNVSLSVNGTVLSDTTPLTANLFCGVAVNWPVCPDALSATTVKVSGLPTGMKFTDKGVLKKGSKTEYDIPPNTIYGAPTAVSKVDSKNNAVPSEVKITVTTAGKSTKPYVMKVVVEALPAWAVGTFDGSLLYGSGIVQGVTVAANGKISGKILEGERTWTLSAESFDFYDADAAAYLATLVGKANKAMITNEIEVVATNGVGTVNAWSARSAGGTVGLPEQVVWIAFQNLWKRADTKLGQPVFKKNFDVNLNNGLKLTFKKDGVVAFAGTVGCAKVSGTSQMVWNGGGALPNGWLVTVYAPPKGAFAEFCETYAVTLKLDDNNCVTDVEVHNWGIADP